MSKKKEWKKMLQRVIAFGLACTLMVQGWINYGLLVWAAEELTVELSTQEAVYSGDALAWPQVTVTKDDVAVTENSEGVTAYSEEWTLQGNPVTEAIAAGIYTCTVSATIESADYSGTAEFTVLPKTLTEAMVTLSREEGIYTGGAHTPTLSVQDGNALGSDDYTVTPAALSFTEVGTYTITVAGQNNYTGEVRKTFTVKYGTATGADYSVTGESYQDGCYRNDVTLTPASGWRISEDGRDYGSSLTFTESQVSKTIYLKNEADEVSTCQVSFTIDRTAPVITSAAVDSKEWEKSKTVTVEAQGADALYYSTTVTELAPVSVTEDLAGLTQMTGNTFAITDSLDETEKVYYIYGIDAAGNVAASSVSVSKIDGVAPTLSGLENAYYKKPGESIQVTFQATDDMSGVLEAVSDDEVNAPITQERDGVYTVEFKAAGSYGITVTDEAGNTAQSGTITVEQDGETPEFSVDKIRNDAGFLAKDAEGSYYFKDSLQVTFGITETEPADGETASPIVIRRNGNVIAKEAALTSFTDTLTAGGDYIYTIEDAAGNTCTESVTVKAVQSEAVPSISTSWPERAVSVGADTYFNTEPDVLGTIRDNAGIAKIEYKTGEGTYQELIAYGTDTFTVQEHTSYTGSLKLQGLTTVWNSAADGSYAYTFRVTNVIGNTAEAEVAFKVDTTAMEDKVFVAYETDGTNTAQKNDTGIMEFMQAAVNKVFGKERVTFHIYVKDGIPGSQDTSAISGVDTEELLGQIQAAGGKAALKNVQVIEGSAASFTYDGTDYSGYTHVKGEMTLPEGQAEELTADQLIVRQLKDRAGNVLTQIDSQDITGTTVIYIDNVAPVLSIDYGSGASDAANKRIFYQSDAQLSMKLKEAYYEEQVDSSNQTVEPVVTVSGSNQSAASVGAWNALAMDTGYDAGTAVTLPALGTPGETEYTVTVQYQDGSGNALTLDGSCKGSVSGDVFSNDTVIVDNKAPALTAYSILETAERQSEGLDVYTSNPSGDDITVSFTIEDHAAYWAPENLTLRIINEKDSREVISIKGDSLTWSDSENLHTAQYAFDGEAATAAAYHVEIGYADQAGNLLETALAFGTMSNGIYTGKAFILDHTAPVFEISYTKAYRLVEDATKDPELDKKGTPIKGYTAYYNDSIEVSFTIKEDYVKLANAQSAAEGLADCTLMLYKDGSPVEMPDVSWREEAQGVYQGSFVIARDDAHEKDGTYQIKISYQDCAANAMTSATEATAELISSQGIYESPLLVLDTQAPDIHVEYRTLEDSKASVVHTYEERNYYGEAVKLVITIADANARYKELKELLGASIVTDIDEVDIDSNLKTSVEGISESAMTSADGTVWEFDLSTEANYIIPVIEYRDLAGNEADYGIEYVTVDTTKPEFALSYAVSDAGYQDAINYKASGFIFADKKLTVKATAQDQTAGIRTICFTVKDESGKETKVEPQTVFVPEASKNDVVYEMAVPLEGNDFHGTVLAEVYDWSGNTVSQTRSHVVESESKHQSTSSAVIATKTSPSRTVDGEAYYNTDVQLNLLIKDTYSGLSKLSYVYGNSAQIKEDYRNVAGTDLNVEATQERVFEFSKELTLNAANNNKNDVLVKAEYQDNAGHTGQVEKTYNIDTTKPRIQVEYDLNTPANDEYYNQTRTATVTIWERNFNAKDVDFKITNTHGNMPSISSWKHGMDAGDDTKHTCTVTFQKDGDYTFTLSFMDMAGNKADYGKTDKFTIDQTKPVLTVTYDNHQSQNEYYYARQRTATIDIEEHNFDASLIDVVITADNDSSSVPAVSGWRQDGDHHIATVTFARDAEYTFDISGMDLAENKLADYEMDRFVIDQTAPELEIFNVLHMSANKGEVRPGVRYFDINYDSNGTVILMQGYKNGVREMKGNITQSLNGAEVLLDDFAHIVENDDIYLMEATVYDLAGNSSAANIMFSVNRFGSVYTFSEATEKLVGENGTYYTNQEQDLVITETNVDTLTFREITCNYNGTLTTLKEGEHYTLEESGSDVSWKQYTYRIDKENFAEEGIYILTIYSEDRAGNTSVNSSRGKKIEFVVDKTNPSVLVAGVENNGQYRENSHEFMLDVQDNILLSRVRVELDGKEYLYDAAAITEADGKLAIVADSANHWQILKVTAYDAAGNETSMEEMRFLVTSNIFVQFFMNKVLFYSVIGGLVLLTGGAWWLILLGKKKKKKEEA